MKKIIPVEKKPTILSFFKVPPELKKYFEFLIGSISIVGILWGGGAFFNELNNKITDNANDISTLKTEMVEYKKDINTNILEINQLNNKMWNNKFIIYFDHSSDKELIKNLLEIEDFKYNYEIVRISKSIKIDTTKTTK